VADGMSYLSDTRQRKSKRYQDLHRQLWEECRAKGWVKGKPPPENDRITRHRAESEQFRRKGEK